jgi:nucleoside-diphosphate-sugar epimerase
VVIGLGRFGSTVVEELLDRGDDVLGVDFDPRSVRSTAGTCPVIYGDAEDPDLPEQLPLTEHPVGDQHAARPRRQPAPALGAPPSRLRCRIAVAADDEATDEACSSEAGADLVDPAAARRGRGR